MPRLNTIDPAATQGTVREIFDGPLKGKHVNIFKGLANSPAGLKAYLGLADALGAGSLTQTEQEAIALALAQARDCGYCLAAHSAIGAQAGLAQDQILGARRGAVDGDARLNAVVRFALQLHEKKGFVDDRDLADFRAAGLDDGAVVDVIVAFTLNTLTNYFNHVNDTAVDFPAVPAIS